jgi:hypothetical protein
MQIPPLRCGMTAVKARGLRDDHREGESAAGFTNMVVEGTI